MRKHLIFILAVAAVVLVPVSALASGFGYYEHGAKATAMAGAFVGRADDVTAIFYNPAGIAFLNGTHKTYFHAGFHPVKADYSATYMGATVDGVTGWLPPGSLFFATKLSDDVVAGIGYFIPYGLSTDWPQDWMGRFVAFHAAIRAHYIQPTVAFKVTDQLAIGGGVDIVYAALEFCRSTPLDYNAEGTTNLVTSGTGFGGNIGLLYKATPEFNIGFSYKTEVDIDFDGNVHAHATPTGIPALDAAYSAVFYNQGVSTSITLPQIFVVGTMFQPQEDLSFQVDVQWTGWSAFDQVSLDFDSASLDTTVPQLWDDAWALRFGTEYWLDEEFALRFGYIYDQSPIPDATLTPLLPGADRHEVTAGLGYDTKEACCWGRLVLDCAIQYLWFQDRTSAFVDFPATFSSNALILGMGLTLAF